MLLFVLLLSLGFFYHDMIRYRKLMETMLTSIDPFWLRGAGRVPLIKNWENSPSVTVLCDLCPWIPDDFIPELCHLQTLLAEICFIFYVC